MPALDEARAHLDKAREFLEAAELTNDLELFNAADASRSVDWAARLLETAQRVISS